MQLQYLFVILVAKMKPGTGTRLRVLMDALPSFDAQ